MASTTTALTSSLAQLIAPELQAVDELFARELSSDLAHVNALVTHVAKFRGKMLRPMLVLLSGLAAAESTRGVRNKLTHEHVTVATVVEMVHMATLVHDDILDGAEVRRRGATINHLHGNEAAVLLGDFLISHAYHLCSSLDGSDGGAAGASRLIAHTTNIVCEGELTQNFNRGNWGLDEKTYYLIIYRKTAALTEACCRVGGMISTGYAGEGPSDRVDGGAERGVHRGGGSRRAWVEGLATYGAKLGMAFQIVDDILDICGQQSKVGKSLGTDIEKGKLTLPMIHFLKHAAPQHRELMIGLMESQDDDRVERVRQLIGPSESVAYARGEAQRLVDEAVGALEVLPASEAREALVEAAQFVMVRER